MSLQLASNAGRHVITTGLILSLGLIGLSFSLHNFLHTASLQNAERLENQIRSELDAPAEHSERGPQGAIHDPVQLALAYSPRIKAVESSVFYDSAEIQNFKAEQMRSQLGSPDGRPPDPTPPQDVTATYSDQAVTVSWKPGPANAVLENRQEKNSLGGLTLVYRVYRGTQGQPPELVASLPAGARSWWDVAMPLARSSLDYEVWAVLARPSKSTPDLIVNAQRSDSVTVETPEHFSLMLESGDSDHAVFKLTTGSETPDAPPLRITSQLGESLFARSKSTGLTLQALRIFEDTEKITLERLVLTSDGSIVLDPDTHKPRTTKTQILSPVNRLVATLLDRAGDSRSLEVVLP